MYPPCTDGQPSKLEGDILGHGGYTAVELSRFTTATPVLYFESASESASERVVTEYLRSNPELRGVLDNLTQVPDSIGVREF